MISIYLITNFVNGKRYVGITSKTIKRRWTCHLATAKKGSKTPFHKAIRKYGSDAFYYGIVTQVETVEEAYEMEKFYIKFFDTYVLDKKGYNCTRGGDGITGYKRSKEDVDAHSKKMRQYFKENPEKIRENSRLQSKLFITFNGQSLTTWEWEQITGINREVIYNRIRRRWTPERALTTPLIKQNRHFITFNGETKDMKGWAKSTGLSYNIIRWRIFKLGWDIEKTLTTSTAQSRTRYKKAI